ncbi:MAG: hypothetical protein KDK70_13250 [Myxococcales bacterium]|nr:hypothetical protein [Myxococcales bacterium]
MNTHASMLLHAGIDNALFQLEQVLPAYAAGALTEPHHPHAIAVLFRKLGACRLLTTGEAEPLLRAHNQSVSAYLHRLPRMADDDKVTSRAGVLWDAIGGGYWDAAVDIARHSRSTVNPAWEHEDDFLYVWFLMTRYLLGDGGLEAEAQQRVLLERWDTILGGSHDPRRWLCDALLQRDARAFHAAFEEVGDAREAALRQQLHRGRLPEDDAVWSLPLWLEGLALLRLAERDGLPTDAHCSGVPEVLRGHGDRAYEAGAWRWPRA